MSEFVEFLKELFEPLGPIRARKMFGGYGLFCGDTMFGLIADEVLYLKSDQHSRGHFESLGLSPFEYDKGGKLVKMSYHMAPEIIFDDPEETMVWGKRALEAALRARRGGKS